MNKEMTYNEKVEEVRETAHTLGLLLYRLGKGHTKCYDEAEKVLAKMYKDELALINIIDSMEFQEDLNQRKIFSLKEEEV